MELSERMLKVDTRVFILHLKSLPVAYLSTPTWLLTRGRGPCLSRRGPSKNVGKFAVLINNNNNNLKIKYKFSITIVKKRLLGGLVVFNRANVNKLSIN